MNMRRNLTGSACAVLLAAGTASADPLFFVEANIFPNVEPTRDEPWQAAVDNQFFELDLDEFPTGITLSAILSNGISVDIGLADPFDDSLEIFAGAFTAGGGEYGTVAGSTLLNRGPVSGIAQTMTFEFSPPVAGFGAWIFDDLGPGSSETGFTLEVIETGGNMQVSSELSGGNQGGFFVEGFVGVTSNVGIESVAIRSSTGGDFFEVDHLQIAPLIILDADEDEVSDSEDNCIQVANADQRDTDEDGFGNVCDADFDNDCSVNFIDLAIMKSVFFTADEDADLDGNGSVNFIDLALMKMGFFLEPGPSGLPNNCMPGVMPGAGH